MSINIKYKEILDVLEKIYTLPPKKRGRSPINELIAVILSQNTSDNNSFLAYNNLFEKFETHHDIAKSNVDEIAKAIKRGGLANQKAKWIKRALDTIYNEQGSYSLDFLNKLSDDEAVKYLTSLKGVGPKSSRCILPFSLGRDLFPVDTHVFRVSKRIGLVDSNLKSRERACEHLEAIVKPVDRYRFHMVLILHGRAVCKARKPECERCSISHLCNYKQRKV